MKRNFKKLLMICLIGAASTAILNAQDTLKLNLKQAIEIGLSKSPTIKVANKEIQRVNYSKKERQGNLLPFVSASVAYQRTLKKQKMYLDGFDMLSSFPPVINYALGEVVKQNPPTVEVIEQQKAYENASKSGDGSIEVGRDNTFNAGISAQLPIIAPVLWQTIKMSDIELEMVNESARASKITLGNQISKSYYGILLAQDSYNVFRRTYNNTLENAKIIKNKYQQGSVSEYEWIRADVQVNNALSGLVSAESAVNMSKLQLKMLMGIDMDTEISVQGKLSDFESTMYAEVLSIDTTLLKSNSDIKQFEIQQKQLNQSLKIHRASLLPMLSASFNYQYMSMVNDSNTFSNSQKWFPTSNLGISLSVPIFQGGTKYNKEKQIRIQLDELNYQKDNLKRGIELQALNSIDNIKKSIKKIESNKKALIQAEKAVAISSKMYEVGAATYLDQSNSELALLQAGLSYNQSIYDFVSAKADLEKLLGNTFNK